MKNWITVITKRYEMVILALLVVYFLIISAINPSFFSGNTVVRIAYNAAQLILVTLGVSIVIITRNIDVSVGSLVGLAATLGGAAVNATMSTPMLLLVTLGTGLIGGLVNGIGIAYFGVSSIIMTLGTMAIFRGLLIMYTGGRWIRPSPLSTSKAPGLPSWGSRCRSGSAWQCLSSSTSSSAESASDAFSTQWATTLKAPICRVCRLRRSWSWPM